MSTDASQLLRSLAAGVHQARPGAGARASTPGQILAGVSDFSTLLEQARAGGIASGREIRLPTQPALELRDDQLARLRTAADRAEAHGASQAIFALDGLLLKMDVPTRTVTAVVDPLTQPVVDGIDAFVAVPRSQDGAAQATILPIAGELSALPLNTSLLGLLAARAGERQAG